MTKEELEKEAKEKWWDEDTVSGASIPNRIFVAGYLAGAEPREKRIAELELKIKHLTEHLEPQAMTSLFEQVEEEVRQEQMIKTLDKENAELKEQLLEQKQYTAFKCNEAVKEKEVYEREHYLLTTAKDIIKKLRALYLSPVVTKDDVKKQDEILNEAEQFLNSESCPDCFCEDCTKDCGIKKLGLVEENE